METEQPTGIPPGWRFVSTKNPMMAVQKQSNGDRLLVARHTGYGWVPSCAHRWVSIMYN